MSPEIWLLLLIALAIPFALARRVQRPDLEPRSTEGWREVKFSKLTPQDSVQYRARARKTLGGPGFVLEDTRRNPLGRWEGISPHRGTLILGEQRYDTCIQEGSSFRGQVGARSERALVIRDEERILAEIEATKRFPAEEYRVRMEGLELEVKGSAWSATAEATVYLGERVVAQYRRLSGLERHVALAARPDLPPEVVAVLLYLSLLR